MLTGVSFLSPTRSVTGVEASSREMGFHSSVPRNSGKRSFGTIADIAARFMILAVI
jgi:hypothetical protein